ncbi:MAG: UDP-4-amino-4,6-dideoxy-N-acetyl-beta-L-altrosamine transaminase [Alphaproteobacteria bacterium]|mgnify:CR=1 FL=1|nr:UDP-4-amino-4,6-dideoxy-N-acetyl-beta-L-altrosamine transaminase [Alphaproteobacteria bacterium]
MNSDHPFLPYGRQSIDDADVDAVAAVLRSDWLTTGPAVDELEAAFATATGAPHAVCCANGTAALHMAYHALGIGPGDNVVVPSVTFLATASTAHLLGAGIVFADVDPDTALMTADTLETALGRAEGGAAAVAPVHLAGQMADMDAIGAVARRAGASIVEDACHAIGGRDGAGRPVGSTATGDLMTFSLHPVKTIAAGEGGIVTTADEALAERMRLFRNHGMSRTDFTATDQAFAADGDANPWYYEMTEPALNYRLSDIHAALAASQLARLPDFVERRRALVARYDAALASLPAHVSAVVRPSGRSGYGAPSWHLYVVLIDFETLGRERAEVMNALRSRGIGSQVHYLPLHRQPFFRQCYGAVDLPGADAWYARALSLPLFVDMQDADVDRVVETLHDICEGR